MIKELESSRAAVSSKGCDNLPKGLVIT